MIAAHAIRSVQSVYDALFAGRAAHVDGNQFDLARTNEEGVGAALPQIINPDLYALELRDYVVGAADAVVEQLFGSSVSAEIYHAILKTAKGVGATPLHQDEAYWDPDLQYHSVSIWLPPQGSNAGKWLHVLQPGSHEWEVLEHQGIGGNRRVGGLELVDKSVVDDPVACPLPPGGFTIHCNRTAPCP